MPSPFPGMNPSLEQDDAWHDFHERFIPYISDVLVPQVRPGYIVKLDEHVYIHERSAAEREFLGRIDVGVARGDAPSVSRMEKRPEVGIWPVRLRERLPVIPIPLRAPDADARLDLQEVLNHLYDPAGYEDYIYTGAPQPPLHPDDAAWARQFLPSLSQPGTAS